jgi:hypothetical protein
MTSLSLFLHVIITYLFTTKRSWSTETK